MTFTELVKKHGHIGVLSITKLEALVNGFVIEIYIDDQEYFVAYDIDESKAIELADEVLNKWV